jgi:hypothetical protein
MQLFYLFFRCSLHVATLFLIYKFKKRVISIPQDRTDFCTSFPFTVIGVGLSDRKLIALET